MSSPASTSRKETGTMREIRFRGKRKDNGEWVYGYLIGNDVIVGNIVEFNVEYFNTEFWYKVDPETVGQYTGLHDRNGREIYKGDIISTDLDRPYNIVVFRNGAFMFQCHDNGKDYYDYMFSVDEESDRWEYGEVIGNIYDTPELLKGDENA
jgi:hypothetical protein